MDSNYSSVTEQNGIQAYNSSETHCAPNLLPFDTSFSYTTSQSTSNYNSSDTQDVNNPTQNTSGQIPGTPVTSTDKTIPGADQDVTNGPTVLSNPTNSQPIGGTTLEGQPQGQTGTSIPFGDPNGGISTTLPTTNPKDTSAMTSSTDKSGSEDYNFPKSNSDMKKVFGTDDKTYHQQVKPEIFKQIKNDPEYGQEFKKMGNNPDIGVDKSGNIILKDVKTGRTFSTNWLFKSFLP